MSKIPKCEINEIDDYVKLTFNNLRTEKVYGFMFHSFETFKRNEYVLEKLREHKNNGSIKKIGFSLYCTGDIEYLFEKDIKFDLIQVPFSIFDRRFEKYFEELKKRNVEIHTRSVYLQGLVFMNVNEISKYFEGFMGKLIELDEISKSLQLTKQEIALNFCLTNEKINKVIVGFDSEKQIRETVESVRKFDVVKQNYDKFEVLREDDEKYLLPFNWRLN